MSMRFYVDMVMRMKKRMEWFREQWKSPKFRWLAAITGILMLGLGVEFTLFQYGVLKILRYLTLVCCLAITGWIDYQSQKIPNRILLVMLVVRTVILLAECLLYRKLWMSIMISAFMGLIFAGGMFLLCYLISRGGVGAGDVKLFAVLGYYMGSGAVFSVTFLTVLTAAVFSVVALLAKKVNLKKEIPFAPFIFLGTVLTMALGV